MQLFPIPTPLVTQKDNLFEVILNGLKNAKITLQDGDVLTIATKIVSVTQGLVIKKEDIIISEEARKYSEITKLSPEFMEVSIQESDEVLGACPGALLTKRNDNLMPNAGADQSNAPEGYIIILPKDPSRNARAIQQFLQEKYQCKIGVIVGDSRVQPLRRGTSGLALGVAGFVPVIDDRGRKDLFGREMKMTRRAIADNLMSAAEILSGEVDERVPMVLIRGAPVILTDEDLTDTMSIPPDECMYFSTFLKKKVG
ncbi:MAG TPA: coenzyme F420-0:L-glutamate ligase [candidate division Zixibacteria bacterium]|nr:coenzyme F420-0:L-glutamate ligase [candidate division Zixibacteria bacterium]